MIRFMMYDLFQFSFNHSFIVIIQKIFREIKIAISHCINKLIMANDSDEQKLSELYKDLQNPAAFAGIDAL